MDALGSGQSNLHGAEIAAWQRFLSRDATEKFQKTAGADSDGIVGPETVDLARREGFVVPSGRPDRDHFNLDYDVQLTPELEEVVREIAYHYWLWTGEDLTVISGARDSQGQAEAMFLNWKHGQNPFAVYRNTEQLEEILDAYNEGLNSGESDEETIKSMAAIIEEWRRRGIYISSHLAGRAFDVSYRSLNTDQRVAFREAVKEVLGDLNRAMPSEHDRLHVQM
jgi:hypothetical protein